MTGPLVSQLHDNLEKHPRREPDPVATTSRRS